jgi:hypothetical protein
LLKVVLKKRRDGERSVWVCLEVWGLLGFVALVFGYISAVVVEGVCVSDCRKLELFAVGTVG